MMERGNPPVENRRLMGYKASHADDFSDIRAEPLAV